MSDFDKAIGQTLKNEGGFCDNKNDPGGVTKYGISLRFLEENGVDVNHDGIIDRKDILNLTIDEAEMLYKFYFWEKFRIASINDQKLANKVFDLSVNMGGMQAIKLLQEAINLFTKPQIVVNGILNGNTLNALNSISSSILLTNYKAVAKHFYENLVLKNPKLKIFLNGWLNRAAQ